MKFDFSTLQVGDFVQIEIETDINNSEDFVLSWVENESVLLLKEFEQDGSGGQSLPAMPLANYTIRGRVTDWQWTSFINNTSYSTYVGGLVGSDWNGGQVPTSAHGTAHVEIEVLNVNGIPPQPDIANNATVLHYAVDLEDEKDSLFEDKFQRYSYRYKYADGEYSTFAPWSEVAFIPGNFVYEPSKGYNKGMVNNLKSVTLKDFVPGIWGQALGLDVTEIDILSKEEGSPNVYIVETLSNLDISPIGVSNPWTLNEYTISSEVIKGTLPANQLLRPWDNVPKKALAQDVTGSRIVYGNYEQNYDLTIQTYGPLSKYKPEFKNYLTSFGPSTLDQAEKSIKSLRDYKLGVVFTDEYGRETPILISNSGGFRVEKPKSINYNRLVAGLKGSPPPTMTYFKFFIKETSNEYYNLAMDRWYAAEDGNIWLAFPSTDRNKLDLENSLYFKKGDDGYLENTTRYKVLAIENEAPEFIKTRRIRIGVANHNPLTSTPTYLFGSTGSPTGPTTPAIERVSFTLNWGTVAAGDSTGFENSSISHLEDITDDLYIQFVSSTDYSGQYLVSEITSDRDEQRETAASALSAHVAPTEYYVTLDTSLKDDIGFIFDDPTNPSEILPGVKVQFTKSVIENKPIFDGRFFVKIENDGRIKTQITDEFTMDLREPGMVGLYTNASGAPHNLINYGFGSYTDSNDPRNVNGINFNWSYARMSYFREIGPLGIAWKGPSYPTSMSTIYADVEAHEVGVWFINRSTLKYTQDAGSDGTKLYWDNSNNMNNFSPGMNSYHASSTPAWTFNNKLGNGITHPPSKSNVNLAFGGINYDYDWHVDPNQHLHGALGGGFWAIGWTNPKHSDDATTQFVDRLESGQAFRWKEDPTETLYTVDNQVQTQNQVRFGRNDVNVSMNQLGLIAHPSSYHKNWNFDIKPSMSAWDPAGPLGTLLGTLPHKGLNLQGITIVTHDIFGMGSGISSGLADVNTIYVNTLSSVCSNSNILKPVYRLHKGMMLTSYANGGAQSPSNSVSGNNNVIIKHIGAFDVANNGYPIELGGYYHPLHWNGTEFPTAAMDLNSACTFQQVTMNGASNHTVLNTDNSKPYWTDSAGTVGLSGAMGAVGYTLEMMTPIDEYSDGGNLPADPFVWETEPKDDNELDIYYEISENLPLTLTPTNIVTAIPINSTVMNESGAGLLEWNGVNVMSNTLSLLGDTIGITQYVWIGPGQSPPDNNGNITQPLLAGDKLKITKANGLIFDVTIQSLIPHPVTTTISNTIVLKPSLYNSNYHLNWHNCYSFGNGVESNRIKDNFNLPFILNGIKASTTLDEEYKQERREHGLIYSGLYNSNSGTNNLNQFIQGEKITKDINPTYGSIQKIHARDTKCFRTDYTFLWRIWYI